MWDTAFLSKGLNTQGLAHSAIKRCGKARILESFVRDALTKREGVRGKQDAKSHSLTGKVHAHIRGGDIKCSILVDDAKLEE